MGADALILLDTSILVDLDLLLPPAGETLAASIISRAELELGRGAAPTRAELERRTERLRQLDEVFDWLTFDRAASAAYGVVAGRALRQGVTESRVRGKDAMIAGHAHSLGAAVMTSNTRDFDVFSDSITILPPTWRH